jgi:hypothetical protein
MIPKEFAEKTFYRLKSHKLKIQLRYEEEDISS